MEIFRTPTAGLLGFSIFGALFILLGIRLLFSYKSLMLQRPLLPHWLARELETKSREEMEPRVQAFQDGAWGMVPWTLSCAFLSDWAWFLSFPLWLALGFWRASIRVRRRERSGA